MGFTTFQIKIRVCYTYKVTYCLLEGKLEVTGPHVSFSFSSYQHERADVRYVAVMDHRTDVRPPARHDETSFAGLPQPGPEGRGPDEEGSGADKHRRAAEDGD